MWRKAHTPSGSWELCFTIRPASGTIDGCTGAGENAEGGERVAHEVEDVCVASFGRDRIQRTSTGDASTIRRLSIDAEPLLMVGVNGRGDVTVLLDNYESDGGDWSSAVQNLCAPRLVHVHHGEGWLCCFSLDGPGGWLTLYTEIKEPTITDAETERWLRPLPGWSNSE